VRKVFDEGDEDDALLQALAAMQQMSKAGEPRQLFKFAADFILGSTGDDAAHAVLVVSESGLSSGEFRVTRRLVSTPHRRLVVESFEDETTAPVLRGGIVGSMLRRKRPELVREIELRAEDPLAEELAGMAECLVLPVFHEGRVARRYLVFRQRWGALEVSSVERAMLLAGFVETSIANLQSARWIEAYAQELSVQLERVSRQQKHLLPRAHAERPGRWAGVEEHCPSLDVGLAYRPAIRAGGDYFQFFPLRATDGAASSERLVAVVADVSGHSADAAMVMSMLHAILRGDSPLDAGPGAVLSHLNSRIHPLLMEGQFVTAAVLEIDPGPAGAPGRVRYSTGAHPPPRLVRAGVGVLSLEHANGGLIGLEPGMVFPEAEAEFRIGDRVLIYSDGLIDSLASVMHIANANSVDLLDGHLTNLSHLDAEATCTELMLLARGEGSGPAIDDITTVCVGRRAPI
jgi:sigma-B regulation protein RsbU (phosphoserine phosphatase)